MFVGLWRQLEERRLVGEGESASFSITVMSFRGIPPRTLFPCRGGRREGGRLGGNVEGERRVGEGVEEEGGRMGERRVGEGEIEEDGGNA